VPIEADRLITDRDARISSSARRTILQQGRIHLRRLNFVRSFLLQARGGPYIINNCPAAQYFGATRSQRKGQLWYRSRIRLGLRPEMKHEVISDRLLDQRIRNGIMDELAELSDGEASIRRRGPWDYFNDFFWWFPEEREPFKNAAMTAEEHTVLSGVLALMKAADQATPRKVSEKELIRSGWPERIAPVAQKALAVFMQRGRFSEDHEQAEPSSPTPWS
jgi:hypothetical protein